MTEFERKPIILYKEVFIISKDVNGYSDEDMFFFESLEAALDHLANLEIFADETPIIVHGVVTPATVIPAIAVNQRQKFIIKYDESTGSGTITEFDGETENDLVEEVECMIDPEIKRYTVDEDEEVYIAYGYQIKVVLSIDENEMDEETIDYCRRIGKVAKRLAVELED